MTAKHIKLRNFIDETCSTKTRTPQSNPIPSKRKRKTNKRHRIAYPHSSDRSIRKKIADERKLKNHKSAIASRQFRKNRQEYLDKQLPKGLALKALLQNKIMNNTQNDSDSDSDEDEELLEIKNILEQMVDNSGIEFDDYQQIIDNKEQETDDFICRFLNDYMNPSRNNKIDDLYLETDNEPSYKTIIEEMTANSPSKKNKKKSKKRRKQSAPKSVYKSEQQIKLGIPGYREHNGSVSQSLIQPEVAVPHVGSNFHEFFNNFSERINAYSGIQEPKRKKRKVATVSIKQEKQKEITVDCNMEENEWWNESLNDTMQHADIINNYSSNNVSPTASTFADINYSPAPSPFALHFPTNPYNLSPTNPYTYNQSPITPVTTPSSISSPITPFATTPTAPMTLVPPILSMQQTAPMQQIPSMVYTPTAPISQIQYQLQPRSKPLYVNNLISPSEMPLFNISPVNRQFQGYCQNKFSKINRNVIYTDNDWTNSDELGGGSNSNSNSVNDVLKSLNVELNMLEQYAYPEGCTSYAPLISRSTFN